VVLSPLFLLALHFLTLPIRLSRAAPFVGVGGIETGPLEGSIEVAGTTVATGGGRSSTEDRSDNSDAGRGTWTSTSEKERLYIS